MSFVQRELDRINTALNASEHTSQRPELYAAQQALAWALDPTGVASPYAMITGTEADSADCSAHRHLPPS